MPYHVYNHSSEDMSETASESVELVVTSPPYNIGTVYETNNDTQETSAFEAMMRQVIGECSRVLKPGGKLVVECADTTFHDGIYTLLSAQLAHFCHFPRPYPGGAARHLYEHPGRRRTSA